MISANHSEPIFIVSAARTPIGAFGGSLAQLRAPELGAIAIKGALARAKIAPDQVEEVFMGNVLTGGIGQDPARPALSFSGRPKTVPATTQGQVFRSRVPA